ncbi:hypothetical protein AAY473_015315 [Plecturocebus cupreus]
MRPLFQRESCPYPDPHSRERSSPHLREMPAPKTEAACGMPVPVTASHGASICASSWSCLPVHHGQTLCSLAHTPLTAPHLACPQSMKDPGL